MCHCFAAVMHHTIMMMEKKVNEKLPINMMMIRKGAAIKGSRSRAVTRRGNRIT